MTRPRRYDVPKGAAITVVALVLLASLVMGREAPTPPPDTPWSEARANPVGHPGRRRATLDIERLQREKRSSMADLFAPPAPPAPAAAAPSIARPVVPPRPTVPPLPFTYLGRMTEDRHTLLIVAVGDDAYSALPGETIDDRYRLERMETPRHLRLPAIGGRGKRLRCHRANREARS